MIMIGHGNKMIMAIPNVMITRNIRGIDTMKVVKMKLIASLP